MIRQGLAYSSVLVAIILVNVSVYRRRGTLDYT